jgi:ribosomal protein L37E
MSNYQVLFSGEIAEGAQESAVRENVSRELGIDERKAGQLFSGRTVVIRSHLSQQDALEIQALFADLGALCRIKDLTPKLEEKKLDYRIDREERAGDHTLRDITAAHVECPRCGHMQLEASHCARCGIDIAAAIKTQRKEDLIIEKKIRELKGNRKPTGENVTRFRTRDDSESRISAERADGKAGKIKSWFRKSS